jgi:hypothetical protein
MVADPLARLEGQGVARPLIVLARWRAIADVDEPGAILKGELHGPEYAVEDFSFKN